MLANEFHSVRVGIYWALLGGFSFGIAERLVVTVLNPTAITIGLLSISAGCGVLFSMLYPKR